jgi:hypothetical protein
MLQEFLPVFTKRSCHETSGIPHSSLCFEFRLRPRRRGPNHTRPPTETGRQSGTRGWWLLWKRKEGDPAAWPGTGRGAEWGLLLSANKINSHTWSGQGAHTQKECVITILFPIYEETFLHRILLSYNIIVTNLIFASSTDFPSRT